MVREEEERLHKRSRGCQQLGPPLCFFCGGHKKSQNVCVSGVILCYLQKEVFAASRGLPKKFWMRVAAVEMAWLLFRQKRCFYPVFFPKINPKWHWHPSSLPSIFGVAVAIERNKIDEYLFFFRVPKTEKNENDSNFLFPSFSSLYFSCEKFMQEKKKKKNRKHSHLNKKNERKRK